MEYMFECHREFLPAADKMLDYIEATFRQAQCDILFKRFGV